MGKLKGEIDPDGDGNSEITVTAKGLAEVVIAALLIVLIVDILFNNGSVLAMLLK